MFDYFYGHQSEQFTFYRIPKVLFIDSKFKKLSIEAKLLYGLFLDRMSLSAKNEWFDEQGRVFIIFTIEEIMEALGCAKAKSVGLLKELETISLIERKRQGLGKPNIIFVKNFLEKSNFKKYENQTSGGLINELQEVSKSNGINTYLSDTDINDINHSFIPSEYDRIELERNDSEFDYIDFVKAQVDYVSLVQVYHDYKKMVDEIIMLVADTLSSNKDTIRIAGEEKSLEVVKRKFMKLEYEHIQFVLDCLLENTTKIRNIKQYLLTSLYNATQTIDSYYTTLVNHDLKGNY